MATNYNDQLTANNAKIDSIKAKVDALPDAGGGGGADAKLLQEIVEGTVTEIKDQPWTKIAENKFSYSPSLTSINLSEVQEVGEGAFTNCPNLNSVDLPKLKNTGDAAFSSCTSLKTVNSPHIINIANFTFRGTLLEKAIFEEAVNIGFGSFVSCSALNSARFSKAESIDMDAFRGCNSLVSLEFPGPILCVAKADPRISPNCQIYVPANLLEQYKTATNWVKYASQFVAIA